MATDKDLLIRINADAKSFQKGVDDAKKKAKELQDSLSSISKKSTVAFLAVSAAIGGAVKVFADYQTATIGVAKTTGLAGKGLDNFSKGIDKLSRTIPQLSPVQLLNIAQTAGQLGVKGTNNLLIFTETYAKLGTATNIAGEEGAASIARLLNSTREGIGVIKTFGDVIVELGNNSAATESEILEMATRLGGLATYGAKSTEILGIGAALKSVGLNAEEAGTAVTTAFKEFARAIGRGGAGLEALIKITGLSAEELKEKFGKDAVGVFRLFSEGLSKVPVTELNNSLEALGLGGTRVTGTFSRLSTSGTLLADSLNLANQAAKEGVALDNEFAAASDSLNSSFGLLKNSVLGFIKTIGAELAPTIEAGVKVLTRFFNFLTDTSSSVGPVIASFLKWGITITGITAALSGLGLALIAVRTGLKALAFQTVITTKIMDLFWIAVTGPIGRIIAGISKITGGFQLLKQVIDYTPATPLEKINKELQKIEDKQRALQTVIINGSELQKKKAEERLISLEKEKKKLEENKQALEAKINSSAFDERKNKIKDLSNELDKLLAKTLESDSTLSTKEAKRIDAINKEIAALDKLNQKKSEAPTPSDVVQKVTTETVSTSSSGDSGDGGINKEQEKTKLKIENAKREVEVLKQIRQGASSEEISLLKERNSILSKEDEIRLENKLLLEEKGKAGTLEGRRAEIDAQLQLNNQELANLQIQQELLSEARIKAIDENIAKAKEEGERIALERGEASADELRIVKETNQLIREEQAIQLENTLLNAELQAKGVIEARQREINKELELNAIRARNIQDHYDLLNEQRLVHEEKKAEATSLIRQIEDEQRIELNQAEKDQLQEHLEGKKQITDKYLLDAISRQKGANDQFIDDEKRLGTTNAKIRQFFYSREGIALRESLDNLASLRNAKSKTAQRVGKAAAIAEATVSTYLAATKQFAALSTFPPLAYAAAAAAIAAGFVQIQNIQSTPIGGAVAGGLVTGGITGKDTEPFMLAKGESIVPADVTPALLNTFEQLRNIRDAGGLLNLIGAPRVETTTRIQEQSTTNTVTNNLNNDPQNINISIGIEDNAIDFITAKQRENSNLSIGII